MTHIAIFPDSSDGFEFRAFAGAKQAGRPERRLTP